jgi:hypothetical protein
MKTKMKLIESSDFQNISSVKIFKNQIYEEINHDAELGTHKFVDSEFTPHNKLVFYSKTLDVNIPWNRPIEITRQPCLIKDNLNDTCANMCNSETKIKTFTLACAALSRHPKLINQLIPNLKEQKLKYVENSTKDSGAVHFVFWKFGTLWNVTIDDLLPLSPVNRLPLYSYCQDYSEFWVSLLEKAYVKFFFGDYESIKNRSIGEILVDMTAGVHEGIDQSNLARYSIQNLYNKLKKSVHSKDLIIFSYQPPLKAHTKAKDEQNNNVNSNNSSNTSNNSNKTISPGKSTQNQTQKDMTGLVMIDIYKLDLSIYVKFFTPWKDYEYNSNLNDIDLKRFALKTNELIIPLDESLKLFNRIDIIHKSENLFYELSNSTDNIIERPCYGVSFQHKWSTDYKLPDKNRSGCAIDDNFLFNPQVLLKDPFALIPVNYL